MLKRLLALGLIIFATCGWGGVTQGTTLDNGLVGHWTMDSISGSTLLDSSGKNNTGVITGAIQTGGKIGKCLYFDGINDGVVVPHSDSFALMGNFTLNIWVKPMSADYGQRVINKRDESSVFDLHVVDSNGFIDYFGSQTRLYVSDFIGRWIMVTIRFQDGVRNYFIDNVRQYYADIPYTPIENTAPISIGNWSVAFSGYIDDTRIYNRALSDDEISQLYNETSIDTTSIVPLSGSKPMYEALSTNDLVLHYKMDEISWNGTAGEVTDSAGNWNGLAYAGTQTRPSFLNRAGFFDGVNDCIDIPNSLLVGYPFSVAFWFKTSQENAALANKYDNNLIFSYVVIMWGGTLRCGVGADGKNFPLSTLSLDGTYNDGQWHHVAMTAEVGGMVTGYVDGEYKNSGVFGAIEDIAVFAHLLGYMSHAKDGPDYFGTHLNGALDDFRMYSRAITSNEVVNLYNATLKAKKPIAVYQGGQLIFNPDKKSYAKEVLWSPKSLSGLKLWLNADNVNGGNMSSWKDQSDSAFEFFPDTGSISPYKVRGLNGRNVVRFSNANWDHCVMTSSVPAGVFVDAATLFVVVGNLAHDQYNLIEDEEDGWWRYNGDGNAYPSLFVLNRLESYAQTPYTGNHVFEVLADATTYRMAIDGVFGSTREMTFSSPTKFVVGGWANNPIHKQFVGDMCEIIIYNRKLNRDERQQVSNYLQGKWGFTLPVESE